MDFRREVQALLDQIPDGRTARLADLARALGDVRASAAIYRVLRDDPSLRGAERVVRSGGRPIRGQSPRAPDFSEFRSQAPLAALREEQARIAAKVSRRNGFREVRTVGGVDVSYDGGRGFASLVILGARDLAVLEEVLVSRDVPFPYIPTYLAYREWPLVAAAVERLGERPDVLLVDGHGQLHPARCGIACHVGVRLGLPTIGVAKNPLVGTVRYRPKRGKDAPVDVEGRVMGYALRTGASVRPIYVSTGHLVNPRTAVRVVRELCTMRHPEPLRLAHVRATSWKRRQKKNGEEGSVSLPPRGRFTQSEGGL